jgi:hypothetical protein
MQLVARIRATFSVEVPLSVAFNSPSLQLLAAHVGKSRYASLISKVAEGGNDVDELIERVAGMSEGEVKRLTDELRMEGRP